MDTLRKPELRYSLILAAVAIALWTPRLRGPIDLRYDAGVYYILGTSLAEGKGYRLLNEPGEVSALQYPPLLPALVAVEQKLLGTSDPEVVGRALRWTYFAVFLVYTQAVFRLARRVLTPGYAFLVALICTLSFDALYLSELLHAELPFAAVTVLFALGARSLDGPERPRESARRFTATATLATAAFLMRSAGVAVLGAWVGEALLRRQWKYAALRCAVAAAPFLAWQAWVAHVRGGPEYATPSYAYQRASYQYYNVSYVENVLLVDSFKPHLGRASAFKLAKRVVKNSLAMPVSVGNSVSFSKTFGGWALESANKKFGRPGNRPLVPWKTFSLLATAFGVATFGGVVVLAIRGLWFVPLYVCATIFLICLTPWPGQFQRYLFPLSPFLVLSLVLVLAKARQYAVARPPSFVRSVSRYAILAALGFIPAVEVAGDAVAFKRRAPMAPGEPKLFFVDRDWVHWWEAAAWAGAHAGPADVVVTSAPQQLYLRTGRKSVLPPMEYKPDVAQRLVDSIPARYVIVCPFRFMDTDLRYSEPMIQANASKWNVVFTAGDGATKIYERVHQP